MQKGREVFQPKVTDECRPSPRNERFRIGESDLELTERKCVKVDEHMQSSVPGVYVCGDLNGVSLLAHTAVREAEVAVHHILGKKMR